MHEWGWLRVNVARVSAFTPCSLWILFNSQRKMAVQYPYVFLDFRGPSDFSKYKWPLQLKNSGWAWWGVLWYTTVRSVSYFCWHPESCCSSHQGLGCSVASVSTKISLDWAWGTNSEGLLFLSEWFGCFFWFFRKIEDKKAKVCSLYAQTQGDRE